MRSMQLLAIAAVVLWSVITISVHRLFWQSVSAYVHKDLRPPIAFLTASVVGFVLYAILDRASRRLTRGEPLIRTVMRALTGPGPRR